MRTANVGGGLKRGVYVAPWVGENGELILVAVKHNRRLAGEPIIVPIGGNHLEASDELWRRLDTDDAIPNLKLV